MPQLVCVPAAVYRVVSAEEQVSQLQVAPYHNRGQKDTDNGGKMASFHLHRPGVGPAQLKNTPIAVLICGSEV